MRRFLLPFEVEVLEEGGFLASCPTVQGCHAEGDSISSAIQELEDVARTMIEVRIEDGLPLPQELHGEPPEILRAEISVSVES